MTHIMQIFHSSIIFWAAWVIIPIVMEIIPTIGNFVILIKKKIVSHKEKAVNFSPEITMIIRCTIKSTVLDGVSSQLMIQVTQMIRYIYLSSTT